MSFTYALRTCCRSAPRSTPNTSNGSLAPALVRPFLTHVRLRILPRPCMSLASVRELMRITCHHLPSSNEVNTFVNYGCFQWACGSNGSLSWCSMRVFDVHRTCRLLSGCVAFTHVRMSPRTGAKPTCACFQTLRRSCNRVPSRSRVSTATASIRTRLQPSHVDNANGAIHDASIVPIASIAHRCFFASFGRTHRPSWDSFRHAHVFGYPPGSIFSTSGSFGWIPWPWDGKAEFDGVEPKCVRIEPRSSAWRSRRDQVEGRRTCRTRT